MAAHPLTESMGMRMRWLIFAALMIAGGAVHATDACVEQLPFSLASALKQTFPSASLPKVTDNSPQDIAYNTSHGGNGCLGVATGNFDGVGKNDFIVGLTPSGSGPPIVVLALSRGDKWKLKILHVPVGKRSRLFVQAGQSGRYNRSETVDKPLARGERMNMTCPFQGVGVGSIGSTFVVYCYIKGEWPYVWASASVP
jgi:hypothetical protein